MNTKFYDVRVWESDSEGYRNIGAVKMYHGQKDEWV